MTPTKSRRTPPNRTFPRHAAGNLRAAPAIAKTIEKHLKDDLIFPGELHAIESALLTFEKLIIAASGSSRHAGLAGEIMIEDLSGRRRRRRVRERVLLPLNPRCGRSDRDGHHAVG